MLVLPRDRDAWASIRGYLYQIDRTVERWLALRAGEALELERGEDIDVVGRVFSAEGGVTEERLLEQVKHRIGTITLRTPEALVSLANFHNHQLANAAADLRFCYLTNAAVGRERLSPFPPGVSGVALWEGVRTGSLDDGRSEPGAEGLRLFLAGLPVPAGYPGPAWATWQSYVSSASARQFAEFIGRFEWSTGHPDSGRLPAGVRADLVSRGLARDGVEATSLADRLFMFVARLLSRPGVKRLTPDTREELLAATAALPAADRATLSRLRDAVAEHADRIETLESGLSALGDEVKTLYVSLGPGGRVVFDTQAPDLSLSPPAARLSPRPVTILAMSQALDAAGWLALHGGSNAGKSQLVLGLCASGGACRGWVRFHHSQPTAEATRLLTLALTGMAGRREAPRDPGWYSRALAAVGPGSLVVLDDLPLVSEDDSLCEVLARFVEAAAVAGVRVASSSQFELPARLRHRLGDKLSELRCPPFTDGEAGDLLRAHGAPEILLAGPGLRFVNGLAAGHPLLLTAAAEFLASRRWRYTEAEIDALIRGDHTSGVMPEVVRRLTRTLGGDARELLYRLTLPAGSFANLELVALAGVEPPVQRPLERLTELLGPWVQRHTIDRHAVSPLAKPLGRTEVSGEVRRRCYAVLADVVTGAGTMNEVQCDQAIEYNLRADEPVRAAILYVLLLVEVLQSSEGDRAVPLIGRWGESLLPPTLSVGERLFVRAYQLGAYTKHGLDAGFVLRDIDSLLGAAAAADGWGVVALAAQGLATLRATDPERVLRYVRRAVELPTVYGPGGRELVIDGFPRSHMLWILVADLRTPTLLGKWMDAVEALPPDGQAAFWDSELGRQSVWHVPTMLCVAEYEKSPARRDWSAVLRALGELLARAQPLRRPRLEAALTASAVEVLGDQDRLAEVPALAGTTLSRWPSDPDVQFRVRGAWGRQCANRGRPDEALPLIDAALAEPHAEADHERLRCLLAANNCVPDGDLRYAARARDLARASGTTAPLEAARALGEYGLAVSRSQGGQPGAVAAFGPWSEAMRRLFAVEVKDRFWRDLFPLFAHATSYLAQIAREGRPPQETIEGDPFVAPRRGFLVQDCMPGRESLYCEGAEGSVALVLWTYASAAGSPTDAQYWMKTAVEESRRTGAAFILTSCGPEAAAESLIGGRFEDAVEVGVTVGRGMVVQRAAGPKTRATFEGRGVDVAAEFRGLSQDQRELGDAFALITGVIPAAVALVRLSLTDPAAAAAAAGSIASLCRELASDQWGDRDLWRTAAEYLESCPATAASSYRIVALIDGVSGGGERQRSLQVLGCVLATWHDTPAQAIAHQLSAIGVLTQWYPVAGAVHRTLICPYVASYWRQAARERRFAFRSPDSAVARIESALAAPEGVRVHAVLSAASLDFRVRGAHEILERLRG